MTVAPAANVPADVQRGEHDEPRASPPHEARATPGEGEAERHERDRCLHEVGPLAEHFLGKHAKAMGKNVNTIATDAMAMLESYDWPGNVRELENVVERAVALARTDTVMAETLPLNIQTRVPLTNRVSAEPVRHAMATAGPGGLPEIGEGFDLEARGEEFYRHYISLALERAGGVQVKAAEMLGMSFRSFRYYAKKFNIR